MTGKTKETIFLLLAVVGAYVLVRWLLMRATRTRSDVPPSAYGTMLA